MGLDLRPRVVQTTFETSDVVIASVVLQAPADALEDAAAVVQGAVNAVAEAGGGVVFLAAGRYRLASPLLVQEGVTLRGDWCGDVAVSAAKGTVLMPVAGKGDPDGAPAITMERGTGLRDVVVWYPEQGLGSIVPYPWTIRFSAAVGGDNMTVQNATLINPYQAIKVGPEGNELHTIRNVVATPLKTGLWLDSTTDIGRVTDVELSPRCWERAGLAHSPQTPEQRSALRQHLKLEAIGVDLGRSDWEYLYNLKVEGYAIGVRLRQGKRGTMNGVMVGCELTDCRTALLLERLNPVGLAATGCRFAGERYCVHAPAAFVSTVAQFNSCEFGGVPATSVRHEGTGLLSFQNCRFSGWQECGIEATCGDISVLDCDFALPQSHIRLGSELKRARILSNRFEGGADIQDKSDRADVQVSHTPLEFEKPDTSPHQAAPARRPATSALVLVTDFGASPDLPDNTSAFTAALAAASAAGGATVYVPAGTYRFGAGLTVPAGAELRGVFDVPHHTVSGGSVLMPTHGRGDAQGAPFIRLEPGSGLRGLTFWYPEQNAADPSPYPWTIQALGVGCWLLDVTLGNSFRGVDFWTHPSTGHVIQYLAGCVLDRGLWVSKCDGDGWVEDVQFNPHYSLRLHRSLPRPEGFAPHQAGGRVIEFQRKHLQGLVFGRCAEEHIRGTFLYAAFDGIAFRDDGGGTNARVVIHGTDTGSRGAVFERVGESGVDFLNAQLVPLGTFVVSGIVTEPTFRGTARFFNSQFWAGPSTALLNGGGRVVLQQLNTQSGGVRAEGGSLILENAHFARTLSPHVAVGADCSASRVLACLSTGGAVEVENRAAGECVVRANGSSYFPAFTRGVTAGAASLLASFDAASAGILEDTVAAQGGGIRNMMESGCRMVASADARSGSRVLRLEGKPNGEYAYVYYELAREPVVVYPDTVLRYWVKPLNESGRQTGLDLTFEKGRPMRDRGLRTTTGEGAHPASGRGQVGEWSQATVLLGEQCAGQVVRSVMCAYDSHASQPFAALFDDLELVSAMAASRCWDISCTPSGGRMAAGDTVQVSTSAQGVLRFTLDGTNPTLASSVYRKPIAMGTEGLGEIRCCIETDGKLSPYVFGALFDVGQRH